MIFLFLVQQLELEMLNALKRYEPILPFGCKLCPLFAAIVSIPPDWPLGSHPRPPGVTQCPAALLPTTPVLTYMGQPPALDAPLLVPDSPRMEDDVLEVEAI